MERRRSAFHREAKVLGGEAVAAAAAARRVRVLEHEAAAHHFVLEVDLNAGQVKGRAAVDQDLDAVGLELLIALARLFLDEVEHVAEARAAAALDADAQTRLVGRKLLLGDDAL